MIRISGLTKAYAGKVIFSGLSFSVEENVTTALRGESGIGKTTLLRCIAGLEAPDGGTVSGLEHQRKSFVFQENRLIENASVLENVTCVVKDSQRAEYFLRRAGLSDDAGKKAKELSGGMKRRLSIARALAFGGDVFFLDEPLRELDEENENNMIGLIREATEGKTVLLITHDARQTERLADRVLYFEGSPMELKG